MQYTNEEQTLERKYVDNDISRSEWEMRYIPFKPQAREKILNFINQVNQARTPNTKFVRVSKPYSEDVKTSEYLIPIKVFDWMDIRESLYYLAMSTYDILSITVNGEYIDVAVKENGFYTKRTTDAVGAVPFFEQDNCGTRFYKAMESDKRPPFKIRVYDPNGNIYMEFLNIHFKGLWTRYYITEFACNHEITECYFDGDVKVIKTKMVEY